MWQETQESLDKKAKECGLVIRKLGALESSHAQLKVCCVHEAGCCLHWQDDVIKGCWTAKTQCQ